MLDGIVVHPIHRVDGVHPSERADMVGSLFVSDAELARYINKGIRELCDKMQEHYGEEYEIASIEDITPKK